MNHDLLASIDTLTFDIFGTVLDLSGGIVGVLEPFLRRKQAEHAALEQEIESLLKDLRRMGGQARDDSETGN